MENSEEKMHVDNRASRVKRENQEVKMVKTVMY